jgi:hypothetical protein
MGHYLIQIWKAPHIPTAAAVCANLRTSNKFSHLDRVSTLQGSNKNLSFLKQEEYSKKRK